MNGVAPSTGPLPSGLVSPFSLVAGERKDVLAAPALDVDGAIAILMKMSSEVDASLGKGTKANIEAAAARREEATKKMLDALNAAIAAAKKAAEERDSGGLFDVITKNLGPVGLIGLCVGSVYMVAADFAMHATGLDDTKADLADFGGAATMLAGPIGLAVYASQMLVKKFGPEAFQKALDEGPSVSDDDVRKANKIAVMLSQAQLALAATLASGGTAAPAVVAMVGIGISTATQVAQETGALKEVFGEDAGKFAMAGMITGAALTMGANVYSLVGAIKSGAAFAINVKNAAKTADTLKTGIEAVHDVTQGIQNLEAAGIQHEADTKKVDAQRQKYIIEMIQRTIDVLLEDTRDQQKSSQKVVQGWQGITQTRNETVLTAGTWKG